MTGLEYYTSLQELYLWDNQISDLNPLAGLANLQFVDVAQNPFSPQACTVQIPALEGKGVKVGHSCP